MKRCSLCLPSRKEMRNRCNRLGVSLSYERYGRLGAAYVGPALGLGQTNSNQIIMVSASLIGDHSAEELRWPGVPASL